MAILVVAAWVLSSPSAAAQTYAAGSDLYFFGDNTEFDNPFRTGDTTLGVSGRVFLDVALNQVVTVRLGAFGLGRFGAGEAFEHREPVVALHVSRGVSRFVFGSLDTVATRLDVAGPDEETPHGLLPPLQEETLSFTRGQEMGLQWLVSARRVTHDAWINWQRLNSETHRERFDAGYRGHAAIGHQWRVHAQWHVVHEGGQRFNSGPVSDSQAGAVGLEWRERSSRFSVDAHLVGTRDVPDREAQDAEGGLGVFSRGTLSVGAWRSHLVVWRGRHTLKAEGDANYLALRRDGSIFRRVRDYGEWGLTRHFRPAPDVHIFAAFRIHRVESHYEYSYRIVGRVRLRHQF
jgi:hypothetical protein